LNRSTSDLFFGTGINNGNNNSDVNNGNFSQGDSGRFKNFEGPLSYP
jgi:hypothetical protein